MYLRVEKGLVRYWLRWTCSLQSVQFCYRPDVDLAGYFSEPPITSTALYLSHTLWLTSPGLPRERNIGSSSDQRIISESCVTRRDYPVLPVHGCQPFSLGPLLGKDFPTAPLDVNLVRAAQGGESLSLPNHACKTGLNKIRQARSAGKLGRWRPRAPPSQLSVRHGLAARKTLRAA